MFSTELENPVWKALSETHKAFAINYKGVKFYDPDICPFGSFIDIKDTDKAMELYSELCHDFFIVGNQQPKHHQSLILERTVACHQMMINEKIPFEHNYKIEKLTKLHINELYDLVWLVMPGYFKKRTFEMGDYYGIFMNNKLVAATGERFRMENYTEISAVVTHPDYMRRGMAKQLVIYISNQILKKRKTPILHVVKENTKALKLYNNLGFKIIGEMTWRHYIKNRNYLNSI